MKPLKGGSTLWIQTCAVLALVNVLAGCGTSDFAGVGVGPAKSDTGTKRSKPETPSTPPPSMALTGLNWYWQCESDPGTAPKASAANFVVQGGGEHKFSETNFANDVPVTMSGRVCPPSKYPRDIVLVIDVSGSMGPGKGNNDPYKGGTCGRYAAVESIIANIQSKGGDARFALVTFSTKVNANSTAMFAEKQSLYADVAGSKKISDVLCDNDLGTNYGIALEKAEEILSTSRPNAMKEIYFISDGAPEDGNNGVTTANRLKSPGLTVNGTLMPVQVATVLLGNEKGGEASLKAMASTGVDSNALYATASDATKLSAALDGLAANDIDTGTMKYRSIGDSTWTEVSLKGLIKDYNFSLPAFNTSAKNAPLGIEATFEYRDLHNNVYSSGGTLKWQSTP